MIWVGVGWGRGFEALKVGQNAAHQAIERLGKKKPDLVIVFSSSRIDQKEILQGIRNVTGNAPLLGCSGAGQIAPESLEEDVVVVTLVSDTFRIRTGVGKGLRRDGRKAGQEAAWGASRDLKEKGRFFLAFSDGLSGNGQDAIRGIQEVLGTSFSIIGSSGGDNFRFAKSFAYYEGQVLEDALCGALFYGTLSFGVGSRHGWLPLGRSRRVTRAMGNLLQELDREPAISIYEDYFGTEFQKGGEPLARKSLFYPLGLSMAGEEEPLIRQPIQMGQGGSLVCTAEVPEGEEVHLMIGTKESLLEATRKAGMAALTALSGKKPRVVFVFESASRKKLLGRDGIQELQILRDLFGEGVPVAGCYGYGEMSPSGSERYLGQSYFLNESAVILALGE